MALTVMQGDSYPIPINISIKTTGSVLTPDMIDDIEVCAGTEIRKTYSGGSVIYSEGQWYIRLSQEETFAAEEGTLEVIVRIKYRNEPVADVKGYRAGRIQIRGTNSKEVL